MENNIKIIPLVPENYWEERQWLATGSSRAPRAAMGQRLTPPTSSHRLKVTVPMLQRGTRDPDGKHSLQHHSPRGESCSETCPFEGQADRKPQGLERLSLQTPNFSDKESEAQGRQESGTWRCGSGLPQTLALWLPQPPHHPQNGGSLSTETPQEGTPPGTSPSGELFSNKM